MPQVLASVAASDGAQVAALALVFREAATCMETEASRASGPYPIAAQRRGV